jgi:site-specific recombinase XerD
MRARHYSPRTETAYVGWVRRFILFHDKRHPDAMGEPEVSAFLSALASRAKVSAATQNQALAALLFLYDAVLGRKLAWMDQIVRAKSPERLPVVLNRGEVRSLLAELEGDVALIARCSTGAACGCSRRWSCA